VPEFNPAAAFALFYVLIPVYAYPKDLNVFFSAATIVPALALLGGIQNVIPECFVFIPADRSFKRVAVSGMDHPTDPSPLGVNE